MLKTIIKIFAISIAIFLLVTCDNYEFPKSPYPRIETLPVINISKTGVTFQANITQLGEKEITNHGFVWGLNENLSIDTEDKIQLGATSGLGNFEADVKSGLFEGETYFVKAFVATADYFVYGEAVSFTSKGSTPPIIESFSPFEGTWGDTITIKGDYFSALAKNNLVKFGTLESKVVASNDSTIICIVPDNIETLLVSVYVTVTSNTAIAPNKFKLTVPQITDFNPTAGTFLDEVSIAGVNFGLNPEKHRVTFNGHEADVLSASKSLLTVKVPLAIEHKSNELKVLYNGQTAVASSSFTILPPTITALSKIEGLIGDEIELIGTNFNPRSSGNIVMFGENTATVVTATAQSLVVKVPKGVYPERTCNIKVIVAEQTTTIGPFKLLDAWLKKGYTPTADIEGGGFELDGKGYFVAGKYLYSYDPSTNNWTQKADFPGEVRFDQSSFAAGSYGYSGLGSLGCCPGGPLVDLWRYSPGSNSWLRRSDFPNESTGVIGTGLGTKGYAVDGFVMIYMYEYNTSTNSWIQIGDELDARFIGYPHFHNSIFPMDNRLFVFMRENYGGLPNFLYEFDINSGAWIRRAELEEEYSMDGFVINGTGYIKGFKSMHKYDLTSNQLTLNISPLADGYWGMTYLFTASEKSYFLSNWANSQYEFWEFDPAYL